MYKIMVKKRNSSNNYFTPYTSTTTDEIMGTVSRTEWETDDLVELAEKYEQLLAEYTTSEMKIIEELDAEILVEVTDN